VLVQARRCVALVAVAVSAAACTAAPPAARTGASPSGSARSEPARSASGSAAPRPPSVSIGLLAPISGPDAAAGKAAIQGAQLALDVVNGEFPTLPVPLAAVGLASGARLRLVNADSRSDAAAAQEQAGKLVNAEHVVGIVAADGAPVVAEAGRQTERLSVPLVDACSSADYLTDFGLEWYYRTGPTDRMYAETAFSLMRRQRGADQGALRRLAVLEGVSGQGVESSAAVRRLADDEGYDIVARLGVNPSVPASDLVEKLTPLRPDAVVAVVGTDQEAAVVADLSQRMRTVPVLVLGHGLGALTGGAVTGGGSRGVLRAVGWSGDVASRSPVARAVGETYQRRFGVPMSDSAASVFTATLALAMAVDAAGARPDGPGVRGALRQLAIPATKMIMPWDGIRFDQTGQNRLAAGVVEQRGTGGFQAVYPRELASVPVSWRR
jgi:branched-chain amino acid transport system substrate-binding protein